MDKRNASLIAAQEEDKFILLDIILVVSGQLRVRFY